MLVCAFSWEQRKLGEVFTEYSEKNHEELSPLTIIQGKGTILREESNRNLIYDKAGLKNYKLVNEGDFILHLRSFEGGLEMANSRGIVSPAYHIFHGENADSRFYYPFFRSKYFISVLLKPHVYGIRDGKSIDVEGMKLIRIPCPKIEEQQLIGDYFETLDNLITLHQRECFSFDFGSRSAKVAQKTISWEQRKFSELTEIRSASRVHKDEWQSSGVPFYRSSDVMAALNGTENEKAFISEELYEKLSAVSGKLEKGDVLVTGGGSVGKPYIVPNNEPLYTKDADLLWIKNNENLDPYFVYTFFFSPTFTDYLNSVSHVGTIAHYTITQLGETPITLPCVSEQQKIGDYFRNLDFLITLHQREPPKEDKILNDIKTDTLFHEYYCQWLVIYKEGSVRGVTMQKYHLTAEWVKKLIPDVKLCDFDRITYQQLINDYAETHERQTTMDFHHQLKGAILDAVDDGLIARDPTRKVIIKGKSPNDKKKKYLSRYELQKLLTSLDLNSGLNMDWLILLIAKTGMRFSEAIAVTPMDFDFTHQTLSVNKTWDYKGEGGFQPTKNKSSVRKIRLDWQTVGQFYAIVRELNDTAPIFVSKEKKIYNSTLNDVLERHCKAVGIPTISVHGLRHTHASLLLFDGVSIASVAQRLGHSSINTTQKTYLHIIRELENKDIDLIMKSISSLLD